MTRLCTIVYAAIRWSLFDWSSGTVVADSATNPAAYTAAYSSAEMSSHFIELIQSFDSYCYWK